MSSLSWEVVALHPDHERNAFDCGQVALDNYLKQLANQHAKNKLSRTFVAVSTTMPKKIVGFYSLSAGSVSVEKLPVKLQKKLPSYPIPIARIGRLAVDISVQGCGLGERLLMDALCRSASLTEEIGIVGIVVDAKNETAKAFYQKYGFKELTSTPLTLFIAIKDVFAAYRVD